jgi:hypothetical protein
MARRIGPKGFIREVRLSSALTKCRPDGEARVVAVGDRVDVSQAWVQAETDRRCVLIQRFSPTPSSIRWEIEVLGDGAPWTAPIETRMQWPAAGTATFWTAWGSSKPSQPGWTDPLAPVPFDDLNLTYGGVDFARPDSYSIPLATVLDPQSDTGLSLALSPEDLSLDTTLTTTCGGEIVFSRANRRISARSPVRFAMDLVPHRADWREALGWMVARYPAYFDPPNPRADDVAGCGAYSAYEGELDVKKLTRMAFSANWKASFDFPHMGMYLPPVGGPLVGDTVEWQRFGGGKTTIRRMAEYSRQMRAAGFHVLNYFNVTEYGAGVQFPPPPRKAKSDADLWRDANDFLWYAIPDAVLYDAVGRPYGSWEGAVATDCAGPKYQAFLLDQARRHVRELPESSGICIDRLDWTRLYNPRADDGASWINGKPARSLIVSWQDTLGKLGPIMHAGGKVIYVNPLNRRLELLRQVDGLYDEMGGMPHSVNLCALMGVRKPVMEWTGSVADLQPNPDPVFQRCLYMGVFPTVPFPANDHTINPDAWAEGYYLQYGPLLDALRGRKWVLRPHAIEVEGAAAKANLFEVPGGYVVPVTFGGDRPSATVVLRGLPRLEGQREWRVEVCQPGGRWRWLPSVAAGGLIRLEAPLRRGCAMVRLSHTWMLPKDRCFTGEAALKAGTLIAGATLRYTLDGSEPTGTSPVYARQIKLRATTMVRLAVFRDGQRLGRALSTKYVKTAPSAPTITPPRAVFGREVTARLDAPLERRGACIRYTLDGSDPTAASSQYTSPLKLTETTTVKARVWVPGAGFGPVQTAIFAKTPPPPPPADVSIGDLQPLVSTVGWGGYAKRHRSIEGRPLSIAGRAYAKGMGVSAISELVYDLKPEYKAFAAAAGLDDEMRDWTLGSITYQVFVDGKLLHESPVLRQGEAWFINVPIPPGSKQIRLVVGDAGDGINCDHGDWGDAGFLVR